MDDKILHNSITIEIIKNIDLIGLRQGGVQNCTDQTFIPQNYLVLITFW